jgi:non-heme chloroperoxidase
MSETLRIDDLTVWCARPARTRHRPVLLVHGYFATAAVFREWLPFFAQRGVEAYAINLRGREGSRPTIDLGKASIADFVDDVAAVAAHLDRPVVVGHSMGGLLAQCVAERGLAHAAALITPAPPRGISVLSPGLVVRQLRYLPAIIGSRPVHPSSRDLNALVLNHVPPSQRPAVLRELVPDSGRAGRDMSISGVPVDARRVRCPVFVVGADDDRFIPPQVVRRIASRYGAPIQTMVGRGHLLVIEPGWKAVADVVERWCSSV